MRQMVAGGLFAIMAITSGFILWQSSAGTVSDIPALPAEADATTIPPLPVADPSAVADVPLPPEAKPESREARRFNRYDRDRDNAITRLELMSSRTKAFKKLDRDGNNLLDFEEWASATSDKFAKADVDGNGRLSRAEFATTKPPVKKAKCKC